MSRFVSFVFTGWRFVCLSKFVVSFGASSVESFGFFPNLLDFLPNHLDFFPNLSVFVEPILDCLDVPRCLVDFALDFVHKNTKIEIWGFPNLKTLPKPSIKSNQNLSPQKHDGFHRFSYVSEKSTINFRASMQCFVYFFTLLLFPKLLFRCVFSSTNASKNLPKSRPRW